MQLYTATLARLLANGAKLALILRAGSRGNFRLAAESRVVRLDQKSSRGN
jgi:hypothetical protein